ncbi:hypothetical protein [Sphaerotilus uruguayifluvii]|uniref:Uncharacterized protein n=1 Tax=Sphaerotilus uruguayifluvii TaxID=2735897 RepID=A0ABX2G7L4_9BURK|nr:hypothetical protein [Leptothrix sp. C29]NRT57202.1 hypothetical protein [Leptothrix sp. C29]
MNNGYAAFVFRQLDRGHRTGIVEELQFFDVERTSCPKRIRLLREVRWGISGAGDAEIAQYLASCSFGGCGRVREQQRSTEAEAAGCDSKDDASRSQCGA